VTTRMLAQAEWATYLDRLSKGLKTQQVQIDVVGSSIGSLKLVDRWVSLLGVVYDHKNDLVEIALEGLDHIIHHPTEISVVESPEGLESMQIVGPDGVRQIIKLKQPTRLTAP
jgi:hypothetical protein